MSAKQTTPEFVKQAIKMLNVFKDRYDHVLMSDDLEEVDAIIEVLRRGDR